MRNEHKQTNNSPREIPSVSVYVSNCVLSPVLPSLQYMHDSNFSGLAKSLTRHLRPHSNTNSSTPTLHASHIMICSLISHPFEDLLLLKPVPARQARFLPLESANSAS